MPEEVQQYYMLVLRSRT